MGDQFPSQLTLDFHLFTTTFLVFTTLLLVLQLNLITLLLPLDTALFQPPALLLVQLVPKKISCAKFLLKTLGSNIPVSVNQVTQKPGKSLVIPPVSTVMRQVSGLDKNFTWLKIVGVLIGACKVIL